LEDIIIKKVNNSDFRFVFVLKGILYSVGLKRLHDKWTFYMIEKSVQSERETIGNIYHFLLQHEDVCTIFQKLEINKDNIEMRIFNKEESNSEFTFIFD
jgi:hypothetical protein